MRERERESGYGSWGVRGEDLKEGFIYGVVPRQHEFLAHVRTWCIKAAHVKYRWSVPWLQSLETREGL